MIPAFRIVAPGAGMTVQDRGRPGWRRFGIPAGGAMDWESARMANLLVGNPETAPVLEILLGGARLQALSAMECALTGADSFPVRWRSFSLEAGGEIAIAMPRAGIWSYLAVGGGFAAPRWFGSASANPRAGMGAMLAVGNELSREDRTAPHAVAGRFLPGKDRPDLSATPTFPVWPGPDWEIFPPGDREAFLRREWLISSSSDRTGYRLDGPPLPAHAIEIASAPVSLGTIQIPPAGQPIVLLRDGPTVGGYPRLAILDPSAVSRFTQCAPGSPVRFTLVS